MVSEIYLQQAFQATAVAKPESRSTGLKLIVAKQRGPDTVVAKPESRSTGLKHFYRNDYSNSDVGRKA